MVSVNGLSRFPSPAAKITAFFIMNLTGLYGLVLYLSFFFDLILFFLYLWKSFCMIVKKKIFGERMFFWKGLSDDLDDVVVDNEEFDEFL